MQVIVNNAGITSGSDPFPEMPLSKIQQVLAVNTTAVVHGTQLATQGYAVNDGALKFLDVFLDGGIAGHVGVW